MNDSMIVFTVAEYLNLLMPVYVRKKKEWLIMCEKYRGKATARRYGLFWLQDGNAPWYDGLTKADMWLRYECPTTRHYYKNFREIERQYESLVALEDKTVKLVYITFEQYQYLLEID